MTTVTDELLTARRVGLGPLVERLQAQHDARQDVVSPARALRMEQGQLVARFPTAAPLLSLSGASDRMALRPTDPALGDLAEKLGIPVVYLRRLAAEGAIPLLDANVNEWLARDDRRFLVRGLVGDDGIGLLRAVLSGNYKIVDNFDVLVAMLAGLKETGVDAEVTECDLSPRRMYVTVRSTAIAAMAPGLLDNYVSPFTGARGMDNPVVFAGFLLTNSDTGDSAFTITPRLEVEVCRNGLVLEQLRIRDVHIGGRLPDGEVRWSNDTLQANLDLVVKKTRDAVAAFLDPRWLAARVGELERAAGVRVGNPGEVIELVSKELRFPAATQQTILDHFLCGGDPTNGGVMQAVTSAAQTIVDPDAARSVEAAGLRALQLAARHGRT